MTEIDQYADIAVGDTNSAYSSIFPADVVIGTVEEFVMARSN